MKTKKVSLILFAGAVTLAACSPLPPLGQAYWQRVEDSSALYMTGPKAQQQLEENIATCVREIDELVRLDAFRETMPPDTHSEYHRALDASGDLDYYDTPTSLGDKKIAHSDFHDFESCMRSKGWERVNYVRYQAADKAKSTYRDTKQLRETGLMGDAAVMYKQKEVEKSKADYTKVNK